MSQKQPKAARPYINPYLGGALLGIVLFLAYVLTGAGLGASGAIEHVDIAVVDAVAPSHVDRVAYLAEKAGGDRNPLLTPPVFMLAGTVLGGFLSGLFGRRVKVELRKGPRISGGTRVALALLGGAIMGFGARMARGCTSGQALSGGALLSVGSWAFMFAVFAGAYALAWFLRRVWN